uniref:Quinone oxidoreductase-like protein 1 n=1 Tax=Phallusia mammillata TaxID=59560 RepID=A0A6F9D9X1_9ASCI|nr:quinone oxidoreductase-like protein 1 [Phallusia mammillata]
MKEVDNSDLLAVTFTVKTCSVEKVTDPTVKKYVADGYKDDIVVRDVAGVVIQVGSEVTRFKAGDDVVGVLPVNQFFDLNEKTCKLPEFCLVKKPPSLAWEVASSCLMDGIRAYNALHYLGRLKPNETLLLCNAATPFGVLAVQLATGWGVKVFATTSNGEEAQLFRTMSLDVERTLEGHQFMKNSIMDESGGLGIDCIVDNGVFPNFTGTEERDWTKPIKHDILSCLAVSSRWVTQQHDLQIDPPDSELLHIKNASLCHMCPDTLLLSTYRQNYILHILDEVLKKADAGEIRPHLMSVLPANEMKPSILSANKRIVLKLQ